jgi:transcriptional regulator with XRE-family HTH domain
VQQGTNKTRPLELSEDDLARALQRLRKRHGVSQETLAEESGYHRTYISQLERGLKSPSLRTLGSLARVFGFSTSKLVAEIEKEAARRAKRSERAK